MPRESWKRHEILGAVQCFQRKYGRPPGNKDWRGPELPAPATMRREFESQHACLVAAGVVEPVAEVNTIDGAIAIVQHVASEVSDAKRLSQRQYDDYAREHELPAWRAIVFRLGVATWAEAMKKAGLHPRSSRNVTVGELRGLLQPVAVKWLEEQDGLRGLGDLFKAVLADHGLSLVVVFARISNGESGSEQTVHRIVEWLDLDVPARSDLEGKVRALANKLGRGPTSQELEDDNLYIYRRWPSLEVMYDELDLEPPLGAAARSMTHLVAYASEFERSIGDAIAKLVEHGRVAWAIRQWRFVENRRYTVDFVVFVRGRIVVIEADGYGPTDSSKPRFYAPSSRSTALRKAVVQHGAELLIVCRHTHEPVVGRLVLPENLAREVERLANRGRTPTPLGRHEFATVLGRRACRLARNPRRAPPSGLWARAAAALGSLPFWSEDGFDAAVLDGEIPMIHVCGAAAARRLSQLQRWEQRRPVAIPELAERLHLSRKPLRKVLPNLIEAGAVFEVPGPRGVLYSVDEVDAALRSSGLRASCEQLPKDHVLVNTVANVLGINRLTARKHAKAVGETRDSAVGECMPVSSIPLIKNRLAERRANSTANRPYDGLLPRHLVSVTEAAKLVIPGVELDRRGLGSLARAAGVETAWERTDAGRVECVSRAALRSLAQEARRQAERLLGAYSGIPIENKDRSRHLDINELSAEASSAAYSRSSKDLWRYICAGRLRPCGVHRGHPQWQLHFDRRHALAQLHVLGLPVPDSLLDEGAAADRVRMNVEAFRARIRSDEELRQRLRVHSVTSSGGHKRLRFYEREVLDEAIRDGTLRPRIGSK